MERRSVVVFGAVIACAAVFAFGGYSCGSSDSSDTGAAAGDGGGVTDTGSGTPDSGAVADAGAVEDAGGTTDAGGVEDTGNVEDSGGAEDAGSGGPNSWTYGGTTYRPNETVKCEDRGPYWVIEGVDSPASALTFFLPGIPAVDGTYTIVGYVGSDGGATELGPADGKLALYAGSSMIAVSGTFDVTVAGGKAAASFADVELFYHTQGVPGASAGTASGSLTCP